ncbi:Uncharacterized protein OBRU01_01415 [Operophtera brumata]|uniref:Uncharacterized protein n=1 Tax=Operophtera brumata TaxID=104452 RepID=A0A0L7KMY5_OPEBR|nr:Uncharacterized protein OBRU01_24461 [Operophtera brumata]KOB78781.1 Uncharacterized protein OBRU01_01415 [Operophtera brumata]
MVRTRSVARREHARDAADNRAQDGDFPQVNLQDPIPSTSNTTEVKDSEVIQHPILSRTAMPASSIKSEQPPPAPPASHKGERRSLKSIKGSTPSMRKKRQQLILEAETKKAQVRMELIDKKLDADLASLDEEYSSHDGSESRSRVEKWMDRSYLELNKGLPAPEDGHFTGEQCLQAGPPAASLNPPAPRAQAPHVAPPAPNPDGPPAPAPAPAATASTEGTVQVLPRRCFHQSRAGRAPTQPHEHAPGAPRVLRRPYGMAAVQKRVRRVYGTV